MRSKRLLAGLLFASAALIVIPAATAFGDDGDGGVTAQAALGDAISYQGRLTDGGEPAEGEYDIRFILYDAESGGTQVGATVTLDDIEVEDGLFTAALDFGAGAFDGDERWLEIAIRPGDSTGSFQALSPRQAVNPTPYALYAKAAGLALPFAGTVAAAAGEAALDLTSTGDGAALALTRETTATAGAALDVTNEGAGAAIDAASTAAGGVAGSFAGDTAVELDGAIAVGGDAPAAFVLTLAGGTCMGGGAVPIDHPHANGDPNAIILLTFLNIANPLNDPVTDVGLTYDPGGDCPEDRWVVYRTASTFAGSEAFNVLIIKTAAP